MMWLTTKLMGPAVTVSHQPPCVLCPHCQETIGFWQKQNRYPQGVLLPSKYVSWLLLCMESRALKHCSESSKKIPPLLNRHTAFLSNTIHLRLRECGENSASLAPRLTTKDWDDARIPLPCALDLAITSFRLLKKMTSGAGDLIPLVDYLPSVHEALDTRAHICNLSTWDREARRLEVQSHRWLHRRFKASLNYMRPCLKKRH